MTWQPIETSPRDGTIVILFSADENMVDAGYWSSLIDSSPPAGWFETTGGDHWHLGDVTHWMPMPAPPVVA